MIKDKIKGVLFGQTIGDALGLGTEFMTKEEVNRYYPNDLTDYNQIIQDPHRSRWRKGDWTDDTDMMLCIARAIIDDRGKVNPLTVAQKFKEWFNGEPMGIGSNTYKVLSSGDYTNNPFKAAELVWELSKKDSAANGGVMRTSIVGLCKEDVITSAEDICKLTHADPRCVGSCVIVSWLIHQLVYKQTLPTQNELLFIADTYDTRISEYLRGVAFDDSLEDLVLDDYAMGYTLKTLAAALWTLYHCHSFEEGLLYIVNAGGDADTNAAVACALLGARYGYSSIPLKYIEGLVRKNILDGVIKELLLVIEANGKDELNEGND